jgi:hypothetical protein
MLIRRASSVPRQPKRYKAHRIDAELKRLVGELADVQERCAHKRATFEHKGSTGNWDGDSYWREWTCPTCLTVWTTDHS